MNNTTKLYDISAYINSNYTNVHVENNIKNNIKDIKNQDNIKEKKDTNNNYCMDIKNQYMNLLQDNQVNKWKI